MTAFGCFSYQSLVVCIPVDTLVFLPSSCGFAVLLSPFSKQHPRFVRRIEGGLNGCTLVETFGYRVCRASVILPLLWSTPTSGPSGYFPQFRCLRVSRFHHHSFSSPLMFLPHCANCYNLCRSFRVSPSSALVRPLSLTPPTPYGSMTP